MNERTFRAEDAHKLDDPERMKWLPADAVLDLIRIDPEAVVADVGAGTGYFTIPIAQSLSERGSVMAVDIQPKMLELLKARLENYSEFQDRMHLIQGSAENTSLDDTSIDLFFMANVWHEVDDQQQVLKEVQRVLKQCGRLAIVDWRTDVEQPPGPPMDHRVSPASTYIALEKAGWTTELTEDVGEYSYLMIATPPGEK